ncbi:MAG: SagB/ThcOx family dehydrogenase [Verrucomicrobiales bacterium]|nr:SagB/ThcOx family dehydrogenase [Verrucomicrobiales bacterium]
MVQLCWLGVLLSTWQVATVGWAGEDAHDRILPPPNRAGGASLLQALEQRRTTREFKTDVLGDQTLSDLLWAACGVNRPGEGKRTVPTAKNAQEIDVYVALADGLYRYEAETHRLRHVAREDLRGLTSGQDFARVAPVALVFVADFARFKDTAEADAQRYAVFDTGAIAQNISLYCAGAGLGTVVHELAREPLARAMQLGERQSIIMAQAVGWPK